MKQLRFSHCKGILTLAVALLATAGVWGQSATTSGLNGVIQSQDGAPVSNARVTVIHVPTDSRYEASTSANGRFALRSLRPGGPYVVQVVSGDYAPYRSMDIDLPLGQSPSVDVVLLPAGEQVFDMEAMEVEAAPLEGYTMANIGPSTSLGGTQIARLPNVERSLNDIARLNPFVNVRSDLASGTAQISAAGQNNRFNSINIDGVNVDDPFGLQDNGQPARGNVFALDAIEAITIELSSYDTRSAGYGGASINAVTKSGTNFFTGSIYGYYRNEEMRGKKNQAGDKQPLGDFTEQTWGLTFGGPIIKDKLFFFISYEEVENETLPPIADFVPTDAEFTRLQQIVAQAGVTPEMLGTVQAPGATIRTDDKILAKIDWNINEDHRLSFRYTNTKGDDPIYYNYTGSTRTSTSSHWAVNTREYETFTGQLLSHWTPDFSTEVTVSQSEYDSFFGNLSDLPQVQVRGLTNKLNPAVTNGSLNFGAEQFRHANVLNTKIFNAAAHGDYQLGNHTISGGIEYESADIFNLFFRDSKGVYVFNNLDQLEQALTVPGSMSSYALGYALPGTNPAAEFTSNEVGAYLQTQWSPFRNTEILIGLRVDMPVVSDRPQYFALFEEAFGYRNDYTHDGNEVIQPRLGVNWKSEDGTLRVRTGLGLFYGKIPPVWLANSYSNTGTSRVTDSNRADKLFTINPQPPAGGSAPASEINVLDPDFKVPSTWRLSYSVEKDLPWYGLTAQHEVLYTKVKDGFAYYNDNLSVAKVMPDGRRIFNNPRFADSRFRDVVVLTNTDEGYTVNASFGLVRQGQDDGWDFSAHYVLGRAEDINAGTSSQALSTYQRTSYLNPPLSPDDFVRTRSNFEIRHRFLVTIGKEIAWRKGYETNVTLIYDGHSGRPFSWVFNNDINGDGQSRSHPNDLMYIPSGPDDPLFGGMYAGSADDFFAFIDAHPELKGAKGTVVARNSGRDKFQHRFDLSITQNIPVWQETKFEIFFTLQNFANLLNSKWGAVVESDGFQRRSFASGRVAGDTYQYSFTANDARDSTERRIETRWSALLGARLSF